MIDLPEHDRFATVTPTAAHIVKHDAYGYMLQSWEYSTDNGAHMALASWQARGFEGEPRGWIYHAPTGRYRPGGVEDQQMLLSPAERVLALSAEVDHADKQSDGGTQT